MWVPFSFARAPRRSRISATACKHEEIRPCTRREGAVLEHEPARASSIDPRCRMSSAPEEPQWKDTSSQRGKHLPAQTEPSLKRVQEASGRRSPEAPLPRARARRTASNVDTSATLVPAHARLRQKFYDAIQQNQRRGQILSTRRNGLSTERTGNLKVDMRGMCATYRGLRWSCERTFSLVFVSACCALPA
jgi:hypothetical protein